MKIRSILTVGVLLAATVAAVETGALPGLRPLKVNTTVIDQANAVSQITVRYRPGVNRFDEEGRPNGTAGIRGVSFSFGSEFPNSIVGLNLTPAVSGEQAFLIANRLKATGKVNVADVMFPLHDHTITEANQFVACTGSGTGADVCETKQSWYRTIVGAATALADTAANAAGVNVAVLDTGKLDHPDITGNLLQGRDFIDRSKVYNPNLFANGNDNPDGYTSGGDTDGVDADPTDEGQGRNTNECHAQTGTYSPQTGWAYDTVAARDMHWHGTEVASIIAATRNNVKGISGIAPNVKIVPVRVLGRCTESDDYMNLVNGIRWAAGVTIGGNTNANPVKVINMSLGSDQGIDDYCPTVYQDAINEANAAGIVVIASAGNDSKRDGTKIDARRNTPSNCNHVVSVGATNNANALTWYSDTNADISAPGGNGTYDLTGDYVNEILTASSTELRHRTTPVYQYMFGAGTSFSAPIVSAAVAMVKTKYATTEDNARLNADGMEALLKYSSTAVTCTGCGAGILNIPTLLANASPSATPSQVLNVAKGAGGWDASQLQVTWDAPVTDTWNPITSYTAKAYSAATGGTLLDTCDQAIPSVHSCTFEHMTSDSTVYVSMTATATTASNATARVQMATKRLALAPTNVHATGGANKVTMSWDAVTDFGDFYLGFTAYNLAAYDAQTGGTFVAGNNVGDLNGEITGLAAGTTYWVSVQTMANNGNAAWSPRISVTTNAAPPTTQPPTTQPPTTQVPSSTVPSSLSTSSGSSTSSSSNGSTTSSTLSDGIASKVGKSTSSSSLTKAAGITVPAGAKTSISSFSSKKVCTVSGSTVKMVGKGTCTVTVTVKPKTGKTTTRKVKITA